MGMAARSAMRAFQVLELFERERRPLSLKEIAQSLDFPLSSAAALLKKLSDFDYVHYEIRSRTYLPTLRLSSLGEWLPSEIMSGGIVDFERRLYETTGGTVAIAIQNELLIDYLELKIADKHIDVFPGLERYPRGRIAVTSPLGWMLMNEFTLPQQERVYLRSIARGIVQRDVFSLAAFQSCVGAASRAKYILAAHWPYDNACLVASTLPVRPFGRQVVCGVGIGIDELESNLMPVLDQLDDEIERLHPQAQCVASAKEHRLISINGRSGEILENGLATTR